MKSKVNRDKRKRSGSSSIFEKTEKESIYFSCTDVRKFTFMEGSGQSRQRQGSFRAERKPDHRDYKPAALKAVVPSLPDKEFREKADHSKVNMGLCSICECCNDCVFPQHEGGVWHCEEYS